MLKKYFLLLLATGLLGVVSAQNPNLNYNKFKQLKEELATPNVYRTAGGAPGQHYYQNLAHYTIEVELDDEKTTLTGTETITYINHSPDDLEYLWVQLDQNKRALNSDSKKVIAYTIPETGDEIQRKNYLSYMMKRFENDFDGGFHITKVTDSKGKNLPYTINKTMMRIDLPKPLKSQNSIAFNVDWWYLINDRMQVGGRSGYEYF